MASEKQSAAQDLSTNCYRTIRTSQNFPSIDISKLLATVLICHETSAPVLTNLALLSTDNEPSYGQVYSERSVYFHYSIIHSVSSSTSIRANLLPLKFFHLEPVASGRENHSTKYGSCGMSPFCKDMIECWKLNRS